MRVMEKSMQLTSCREKMSFKLIRKSIFEVGRTCSQISTSLEVETL